MAIALRGYNASMLKTSRLWFLILIGVAVFMSSCTGNQPPDPLAASPSFEGTLRPYPTGTITPTTVPTGYISPTPSPTLTLTPTQVYYEVQLKDDMYSIAFRYGISPQALMTANPEIDPRMMIVGTQLLIPITPAPPEAANSPTPTIAFTPTATPLFSVIHAPDCYSDATGGLWCFILAENGSDEAVENLSALVTLTSSEETRTASAQLPLNLLPAGEALPLIAYFQAPVPAAYNISVEADFLLPVMPEDDRYLDATIIERNLDFRQNGKQADLSGEIAFAPGSLADYVWVQATAYDDGGRVVGVRRWEHQGPIPSDGNLPFNFSVYSLAGAIERVGLLVEAQAPSDGE